VTPEHLVNVSVMVNGQQLIRPSGSASLLELLIAAICTRNQSTHPPPSGREFRVQRFDLGCSVGLKVEVKLAEENSASQLGPRDEAPKLRRHEVS
jgi:hypothetical protein